MEEKEKIITRREIIDSLLVVNDLLVTLVCELMLATKISEANIKNAKGETNE